jgi:hypothetical protein
VAEAFLNVAVSPPRTIADRLVRSYRFRESVWAAEGFRPWWLPAGIFLFRVRYLSDAREEELVQVALSLVDARILRRLDAAIERHGIASDLAEAWPMMAEGPVRNAYTVARGELEQKPVSPLGLRRRELVARLARESERAAAYYDELIRERRGATRGHGRRGPGAGQDRIQAGDAPTRTRGQTRRAPKQVPLEVEVSLRSLLRLYLPRIVAGGRLAGKSREAALSLIWDPVEQTGEPTAHCLGLTYELGLHRSGAVVSARCLDAPVRPSGR